MPQHRVVTLTRNRLGNAALIWSLAVVVTYMTVRFFIYRWAVVSSDTEWFFRDCLMCVPRLLGFIAAFFIHRKFFTSNSIAADRSRTILWGVGLLGVYIVGYFFKGWNPWPLPEILIGLVTSMVVGFFEEYLFRGALLGSLLVLKSHAVAIIFSSLLFTVYHWQAQPLMGWPAIFLVGIAFSNARIQGVSLFSLSVIHGLIDTLAFLFWNPPSWISEWILIVGAGVIAVVTFPRSQKDSQFAEA
jgi:membrane protease YdiL (CAAX protease family)